MEHPSQSNRAKQLFSRLKFRNHPVGLLATMTPLELMLSITLNHNGSPYSNTQPNFQSDRWFLGWWLQDDVLQRVVVDAFASSMTGLQPATLVDLVFQSLLMYSSLRLQKHALVLSPRWFGAHCCSYGNPCLCYFKIRRTLVRFYEVYQLTAVAAFEAFMETVLGPVYHATGWNSDTVSASV